MLVAPLVNYRDHVVVVDYGISNLSSVCNALRAMGCTAVVTSDPKDLRTAQRIILPGVGSFGVGMQNLRRSGMADALLEAVSKGTPLIGLCLGMQLLASEGFEGGRHAGLGLISGSVNKLLAMGDNRVPHVGWNDVQVSDEGGGDLYQGLGPKADFYFVHSFYFAAEFAQDVTGWCSHGERFAASIQRGAVMGVQFHPEKSHRHGLELLKNFLVYPLC